MLWCQNMGVMLLNMNKLRIFTLLIVPSIGFADVVNDPVTGAQIRSSCEFYDLSVSNDTEFGDRIRITRVPEEPSEFFAITPSWGPDRESYIKLVKPDFTVAPVALGWSSYLFISTEDENYFHIEIGEHGSGGVRPYWRDFDTVAIEVWWGRISETLILIQPSSGEIVSAQDRNHFEVTLPCKE